MVMKREIKFRAWNETANRYSKPFGLSSSVLNYTDDDGLGVVKSLTNEVVEQFTGLHDKNGKEIYEGDYVECEGSIYLIKWNEVLACCDNKMVNKPIIQGVNIVYMSAYGEVIGNIHENKIY